MQRRAWRALRTLRIYGLCARPAWHRLDTCASGLLRFATALDSPRWTGATNSPFTCSVHLRYRGDAGSNRFRTSHAFVAANMLVGETSCNANRMRACGLPLQIKSRLCMRKENKERLTTDLDGCTRIESVGCSRGWGAREGLQYVAARLGM